MEEPGPSPPWSPEVDAQVELAQALYEGPLPDGVLIEMDKALAWILTWRPSGCFTDLHVRQKNDARWQDAGPKTQAIFD
jgi:hypothetical protein